MRAATFDLGILLIQIIGVLLVLGTAGLVFDVARWIARRLPSFLLRVKLTRERRQYRRRHRKPVVYVSRRRDDDPIDAKVIRALRGERK